MLKGIAFSLLATVAIAVMTNSFTPTIPVINHFREKTTHSTFPSFTKLESSASPNKNINFHTKNDQSPLNPSIAFGEPIQTNISSFNKLAISFVKNNLFDTFFDATLKGDSRAESLTRSYARFYALETIARVPYFSYLSVLHLYETLGLWRRADYMKVHFCESWNELHHLLIMEELGGNKRYIDRFLAQHVAFFLLLVRYRVLFV